MIATWIIPNLGIWVKLLWTFLNTHYVNILLLGKYLRVEL